MVEPARHNASQHLADAEGSSAVGRELHDARENLGISVSEMATALRIRSVYIEALEEGRFSDLPGRPYALGFARSLATHLGLDPDSIAMRLRDEVMGTATPVELIFPESTEDKRLSRAGWIAISLALVAVAYGGWLALSNRYHDSVPPEFAVLNSTPAIAPKATPQAVVDAPGPAATDDATEDRTPETTVEAVSSAPASTVPPPAAPLANQAPSVAANPTTAPAKPVSPPSPAVAAPAGPAPAPPVAASPPAKTADAKPAVAAKPAPTSAATKAPSAASSPAASSDDSGGGDEEDVTPEPTAIAAVPAAPVAKPATPSPAPATSATTSAASAATPVVTTPASRIVLRARQDSWIQIQSSDGVTVMARTLKSGGSYAVPDRSGLRLTTGNAGALDVIVDGQTMPSLGQIGTVRRNVALDPARLKSGTALE